LRQEDIPLAIVGYAPDLFYFTLFYFTGSAQLGYALITREGETVYLVKKDPERARIESPLREVVPYVRFQEIKDAVRKLMGKIPWMWSPRIFSYGSKISWIGRISWTIHDSSDPAE